MTTLSEDLRKRITESYRDNPELTQQEVSKRFLVSQSTVSRLLKRLKIKGHLKADKPTGRPRKLSESDHDYLKELHCQKSGISLNECVEMLLKEKQINISKSAIHEALNRMKLTRKKNLL